MIKLRNNKCCSSREKRTHVGYVVKMFYAGQSHLMYIQCENGGDLAYIVIVQNIGKGRGLIQMMIY